MRYVPDFSDLFIFPSVTLLVSSSNLLTPLAACINLNLLEYEGGKLICSTHACFLFSSCNAKKAVCNRISLSVYEDDG